MGEVRCGRISYPNGLHPLPLGLKLTYATGVHTLSHLRANAGTPTPAAAHRDEAGRPIWLARHITVSRINAHQHKRGVPSSLRTGVPPPRRASFAESSSACDAALGRDRPEPRQRHTSSVRGMRRDAWAVGRARRELGTSPEHTQPLAAAAAAAALDTLARTHSTHGSAGSRMLGVRVRSSTSGWADGGARSA